MTHEKKITSKLINTARNQWTLSLLFSHTQLKFTYSKNVMLIPGKRKGVTLSSCLITTVKSTSVQKSNKNDIFMARVKYSNCFNFCTQVDPSKTRKAAYFFHQICFYFREKRTFRFHPLESMDRVITGRKLNTFARFAFQRYYV